MDATEDKMVQEPPIVEEVMKVSTPVENPTPEKKKRKKGRKLPKAKGENKRN